MLVSERILEELPLESIKCLYTKERYAKATSSERRVLSSLGYWGPRLPISLGNLIGIRVIKALEAREYKSITEVYETIMGVGDIKLFNDLGLELNLYSKARLLRDKQFRGVTRRKDLYIKGLGAFKFPIDLCYIGSLKAIRLNGYLGTDTEWLRSQPEEVIIRLVQLNFPTARIDELEFAIFAGLDIFKNKLATIIRRLDYIVERNLKADYEDNIKINYSEEITKLAALNNMTLPESGKDLKAAALYFKNCSANYISQVIREKTVIMYNDEHMAQVSLNGKLLQYYGKRNSRPTVEFKALTYRNRQYAN
jgi:hypothetical protein